jgi:hypothetical protein
MIVVYRRREDEKKFTKGIGKLANSMAYEQKALEPFLMEENGPRTAKARAGKTWRTLSMSTSV